MAARAVARSLAGDALASGLVVDPVVGAAGDGVLLGASVDAGGASVDAGGSSVDAGGSRTGPPRNWRWDRHCAAAAVHQALNPAGAFHVRLCEAQAVNSSAASFSATRASRCASDGVGPGVGDGRSAGAWLPVIRGSVQPASRMPLAAAEVSSALRER